MDFARSVFGGNSTEGYSRKNREVETLSEDEEDICCGGDGSGESVSVRANLFGGGSSQGYSPAPGGPFSALTPSMWPQDLLASLAQPEDAGCHHDCRFDEFGFRIEDEDGPEQSSCGVDSEEPFQENPQHRLQWIAYLEFTHNNEVGDLTWDKVEPHLPHTSKLRGLVRNGGIPHSLRPQLWMHLSGAARKKRQADLAYREVVRASANDHLLTSKQIEKDLLRTMPTNACFSHPTSTGVPRLRRVLRGLAWLYPDIGYCQGTSMIAASLLLFLEEEDAFWMLCTIVEDLLPASYYSTTLAGVQADQRVLRALVTACLPDLDAVLREHDIELSLITLHWFLTLFASVVPMRVLLRIWDLLFYDGSIVLFQVLLGMLSSKESELRSLENSAQIFNALSDLPGSVRDAEQLLEVSERASRDVTESAVDALRRKHLAYLMADQGALLNPEHARNLPKQQLTRRKVKRSKSVLQLLLQGDGGGSVDCSGASSEEDARHKNVRQTEILVDLREAILQVARHFQALDPKLHVILNSDYSMESHARDHENFANVSRSRHRRAKALLNFERHDDDELGFRKNDIITIISQKDEHCWIGELNGLRGWFPAKFVDLLDERSKQYSSAGDDSVTEAVTDLVRGTFLRHVPVVYVDYPGETSLKQIYGTFNRAMLRMVPSLRAYAEPLTAAMVEFYLMSQERFTQDMQPHYVYSPRELTRWVRGICEALRPLETLPVEGLVRIWAHEGLRLFQDRLVEDEERTWTDENVDVVALKHFPNINQEEALGRQILYSNWFSKDYVPVKRDELRNYVKARLKVFYEEELDVQLVLFNEVLDHVLRIDRIFRQPQGHLLLIGVSGAGKTTLSRFVAWMNGLRVFQIKVHNKYTAADFDEDLRSVLRRAGCKGEKICFVLDEGNVLDSSFLERMNTLLANGEVPGLFEGDEYAALMTQCKEGSQHEGLMLDSGEELYRWFTAQVMRNLHVVFTMNPSSEGLKDRAATSPALFNRCVLNWFGDWSDDALFQVGKEFTSKLDIDRTNYLVSAEHFPVAVPGLHLPPDHRSAIVNAFVYVHQTLHRASSRLAKRGARSITITPRHYLDFINHYVELFNEKRSELEEQQLHLNVGLQKIRETVEQVEELQKSLAHKSRELEAKNQAANAKLKEMLKGQQEAEKSKMQSHEIQAQLRKQEEVIEEKRGSVKVDLSIVDAAVSEAQQV